MTRSAWLTGLALLMIAGGVRAATDVAFTNTVGGAGGAPFDSRCERGAYLRALWVRHGAWIDGVGAICGRYRTNEGRGSLYGEADAGMVGGLGGELDAARCMSDEVITHIESQPSADGYVGYLAVRCASLNEKWRDTRIPQDAIFGHVRDDGPPVRRLGCPKGMAAIGIYGAAGNALDRVGLVCGPWPKPPPMIIPPIVSPEPIKPGPAGVEDAGAGYGGGINAARCKPGFVWRMARDTDYVCVRPASRDRVARENALAADRVDPQGAYGPQSCRPGYVWRTAYQGDTVCVLPDERAQALEENRAGPQNTVR